MQGSAKKIYIKDLNAQITCKICNGYFVDASTIIECLHTFCRSCIVRYLQKNKYCPVCDVQVHKSKPLLNLKPDNILQDLVYKLVPKLFQNEMQRRRQFYEGHADAKPSSLERCRETDYHHLLTPDEPICLTLSYHGAGSKPRYLSCPAAVTMNHLKKLIRAKYDLSENHRVDILYNQDCLTPSLSLMDVAYIYLWKRKGPIELTYRIYENTLKKLKLEVPDNVQQSDALSLNNNNNWKEVQLRISENGEMLITGIQDSLSPSLLEIVNSDSKYNVKETVEDVGLVERLLPRELPPLAYIGRTLASNTSSNALDSHSVKNTNPVHVNIPSFSTISTTIFPIHHAIDNSSTSLPLSSNNCASLSSGNTTMVFSTINSSKCSTKSDDTVVQLEKIDHIVNRPEVKSLKRKNDALSELEPPSKQPKPIILNHNMGLLNLSNNHPLKKYATLNRNGENISKCDETPSSTSSISNTVDGGVTKRKTNKKTDAGYAKTNLTKNVTQRKSTSKPLAMRAKTLISESGVKPPCYQPRIATPNVNEPKPTVTTNSVMNLILTSNSEIQLPVTPSRTAAPQNKETTVSVTSNLSTSQNSISESTENEATSDENPDVSTTVPNSQCTNSTLLMTTAAQENSNAVTNHLSERQTIQTNVGIKVSGVMGNELLQNAQTSAKIIYSQPTDGIKTSTTVTNTILTSLLQMHGSNSNKLANNSGAIKTKPSTSIGYKTLRDPPKSWNSQISKANISKSCLDTKHSDLKNAKPAKFFKMRNNMPRYLGNPASGVKPMYQVQVSPEKEKSVDSKSEKIEIKKHSIVKIDPKTMKPISEKAPESTSLSNHNTVSQSSNLNNSGTTQMCINPVQSVNLTTKASNGFVNILSDLKINTSSVSIFNPLKLQSSPKSEKKSPKSPHSPKVKVSNSPTGNKREKINRNFTPPNPFIPNLPSKNCLNSNQFIYPPMTPGFATYDPRLMAACFNPWYSQRMPFSATSLPPLNLDLNQRKSLEILGTPGSPKMAQSMLDHQICTMSPSSISTSIASLQRSHNISVTPSTTKTPSFAKKPSKDEKSLETVVEKMTQNRNKTTTTFQKDSSPKQAKNGDNMENPSTIPLKKPKDNKTSNQEVKNKLENRENQTSNVAISPASMEAIKTTLVNTEVPQNQESNLVPALSEVIPKKHPQPPSKPNEKAAAPVEKSEKENSNTRNTADANAIQSEIVDKKNKTKGDIVIKGLVEVKEKNVENIH